MSSSWDEVTVIRKSNRSTDKVGTRASAPAPSSPQKKTTALNKNSEKIDPRLAYKIETESEDFTVKRLGSSVAQVIKNARAAKGMSQKELAVKINEKVSVVVECETGKLAGNPQLILSKIERALGVHLRGKKLGELLPEKKPPAKK